jgi:maleate isomerase
MSDALGFRAKIGVVVPATNTILQPDFEALKPDGVTCHAARIAIPNMRLASDDDFAELIRLCQDELLRAVDRVMACEPDILVVGISSLLVWGGRAASEARRDDLERRTGLKVTGGSFALVEALARFGVRRVAALSPYFPIADAETRRFLEEHGVEVVRFEGLRCASPVQIAHVPHEETERRLAALDGADAEAILQIGTNLSALRVAPRLEARLAKPVLSINAAAFWRALRLLGIDDRIDGFGRLLAEF